MDILKKLFWRKKDKEKEGRTWKGADPGYLACPVVASELKRGKFDSPEKAKPANQEDPAADRDKHSPDSE